MGSSVNGSDKGLACLNIIQDEWNRKTKHWRSKHGKEWNEADFQNYVTKTLKRFGAVTVRTVPNQGTTAGIPDLLVVFFNEIIFIELKVRSYMPSPIQLETIKRLRNRRASVCILTLRKDGTLRFEI